METKDPEGLQNKDDREKEPTWRDAIWGPLNEESSKGKWHRMLIYGIVAFAFSLWPGLIAWAYKIKKSKEQ